MQKYQEQMNQTNINTTNATSHKMDKRDYPLSIDCDANLVMLSSCSSCWVVVVRACQVVWRKAERRWLMAVWIRMYRVVVSTDILGTMQYGMHVMIYRDIITIMNVLNEWFLVKIEMWHWVRVVGPRCTSRQK